AIPRYLAHRSIAGIAAPRVAIERRRKKHATTTCPSAQNDGATDRAYGTRVSRRHHRLVSGAFQESGQWKLGRAKWPGDWITTVRAEFHKAGILSRPPL